MPLLEANGYLVDYSYIISEKDDKLFYAPGNYFKKLSILLRSIRKRFGDIRKSDQYEYIFVQREALMLGSAYFEGRLAKSNAKLIYDFDDAIWLPDNSGGNANLSWLKNPSKTRKIIEVSDLIIAGNQYLADFATQYNTQTTIIPTVVDTDHYQRSATTSSRKICIGWSGSFSTIRHFELVIPALRKVKEAYGDKVEFRVFGDGHYRLPELDIQGVPWSLQTELEELSKIDIGLMPLPEEDWSKGKCGLKGLLYMAMETPTIMSPVGVNSQIIKHGKNGFLAQTDQEWVDRMSELIESATLRTEIGSAGRKTVENEYSVKAYENKFLQVFT